MSQTDLRTLQKKLQQTRDAINLNFSHLLNTRSFRDGNREIDFILVCTLKSTQSEVGREKILTFIKNLEIFGLEFEKEYSIFTDDLIFIKVHAPMDVLLHFATVYKIELTHQSHNFIVQDKKAHSKCLTTEVTYPNPDSKVFSRAPTTLSGERPTTITTAERILIVNKLLLKAQFGDGDGDYGLTKLIQLKIVEDAYPLHDSKWEWTTDGPLSDRQLLAKYWANITMWYKLQPLNLIEKYFGPEIAFYFAYINHYVKMLTISSIIGFLCFMCGLVTMPWFGTNRIGEVCNSDTILCPKCPFAPCKFVELKASCFEAKVSFIFDNPTTFIFTIFMSLWAIIFYKLWKREETLLKIKWNLSISDEGTTIRREFQENTSYRKKSPLTGEPQAYVPESIKCLKYTITVTICLLMTLVILITVLAGIILNYTIKTYLGFSKVGLLKNNLNMISMVTTSILTVICIRVIGLAFGKISLWLTRQENPRTQIEFDNSFIYKRYILQFVNNYTAVIYLAFFKGRFFTHFGEKYSWDVLDILSDFCHPTGCILRLCVQLTFIMIFKQMVGNIISLLTLTIKRKHQKRSRKRTTKTTMPQWEEELLLAPPGRYFLVGEFLEMIIQYGFVTFFVAAFSLAPLCAFINNMIEVRTDAYKLLRNYRRPIPRKVTGIGAWNNILQAATYMGIISNAFVIAFTSDFIAREIYRHNVNPQLKGYINSTLSVFDTKDYSKNRYKPIGNYTFCSYKGLRDNSGHKYSLTYGYWYETSIRFAMVIIFEIVMLTITSLLTCLIKDIPNSVEETLEQEQRQIQNLRTKLLNDAYMKERQKYEAHSNGTRFTLP